MVILVPFSEKRMMLDSGFPDNGSVVVPLAHDFVQPFEHLVPQLCHHWVPTLHILQSYHFIRLEQELTTCAISERIVWTECKAWINKDNTEFLAITNLEKLCVVKFWHDPIWVLFGKFKFPVYVEFAIMVTSNGINRKVLKIASFVKQIHHFIKFFIQWILSIAWIQIISHCHHEVYIVSWISLVIYDLIHLVES